MRPESLLLKFPAALLAGFALSICLEAAASLNNRKIGIDPGHGHGVNQGVIIAEGTWVLDAGFRARTHLQNHGAQVVMTRTTGTDVALSTRANILNSNNVHLGISIHSNAASAAAQGMESYYCNQSHSSASQSLADKLRLRSLSMVHNRNRGTKECLDAGRGFHFYIIRGHMTMPMSLPEYYFHTNDWENRNIHNTETGRENVGRSLYAAVCDYYGVTPTFEPPPPPSTKFSAGDWVRTTADPSLNLRAGPGTTYDIIQGLSYHTVAQVRPHADNGIRADNNNWWYVEVHPSGVTGWLAEFYLEATSAPPENPWPDVIVDNSDPGFNASPNWEIATWAADKHGSNYHYRNTASVSDAAGWSAELPGTGSYDVFAWWPAYSNRAKAAPYVISHSGGSATVHADQTINGGRWNFLGRFNFAHDSTNQVSLSCWTTSGEVVMADAVRFVAVDIVPPPAFYALTTSVEGSGTISRSPDAGEYEEGTQVQLTATPSPNHLFSHWSGDIEGGENPATITMQSPRNVTAHFVATTYVLTTHVAGSGEVQRTPDFVEYSHGDSVELLAVPEEGFEFVGWSGELQSSQNPVSVTMNSAVTLTAAFERTYQAWAKVYFTEAEQADESISGDQANPAGDRIPNLLKYALGLDPREPAPQSALPAPEIRSVPEAGGDTFLTLSFAHPSDRGDVEYQVQLSSDLSDWSEAAVPVSSEDENSTTTRTYRDSSPHSATARRFIRLQVGR